MKWSNFVLFLILFLNILEAIGQDFTSENYFNAFAGFLLLITMSSPDNISVNQTGKDKDLEWDMPFSWIIGYTIWNWIFVLGNWPYIIIVQSMVLLAPLILSLRNKKIWLQSRAFTLCLYFLPIHAIPTIYDKYGYLEKTWRVETLAFLLGLLSMTWMIVVLAAKIKRHIAKKEIAS